MAARERIFFNGGFQVATEIATAKYGHCNCTWSRKALGDGCSVCNPTLKREIDAYNEGVADERARCAEVARNYLCPPSDTARRTAADIAAAIEEEER